ERKTDAKNWAAQTESAIREGRYFKNTAAKKYTVGDLIARYLEHQQNRNQTRALDVGYYLAWWDKEIGMYLLSDLTKNLILTKREKLIQSGINVERRAPATVNRYMGVLSHALSVAVNEWEWLPEHPMKNIAKLPEPRGRVRFLDEGERVRLLEARRESPAAFLYPLVLLALPPGARHGALISLHRN